MKIANPQWPKSTPDRAMATDMGTDTDMGKAAMTTTVTTKVMMTVVVMMETVMGTVAEVCADKYRHAPNEKSISMSWLPSKTANGLTENNCSP